MKKLEPGIWGLENLKAFFRPYRSYPGIGNSQRLPKVPWNPYRKGNKVPIGLLGRNRKVR